MELLEERQLLSTYYVSTTGSDSNNGSASSPFATLQHAANSVVAGDTVDVASGTYTGFSMGWEVTQTGGTATAPITWNASPGAVIDASNPDTADAIDLEGVSYVNIKGFTVNNTTGSITRAGIRAVGDTNVLIENNTVENCAQWEIFSGFANNLDIIDNVASGATVQHGIYVSNTCSNPQIIGNTVFGNKECGIELNGDASDGGIGIITNALVEDNVIYNNGAAGGSAINCDGVQNSLIANNLLYGNQAGGIALFQIDGGGPSINDTVVNNTIVSPSNGRYDLNIQNVSGISVYNNIFYNSNPAAGSIEIPSGSLAGFASDYNVVVNSLSNNVGSSNGTLAQWQSLTGQDLHSIVATPSQLFVNSAANNYQELSTSPSIGAGTSTDSPSTDILGAPRPSVQGYDIGAYESEPAPSVTTESPAPNATNIGISPTVKATFNQPVQAGTINFVLSAGTTAIPASVTYNSATNTATLTPTSALAFSTTYTATVSGAEGSTGVAMTAPFAWSFTTLGLPPMVSTHSPAAGATGVAVTSTVTTTFSEAVQSNSIVFSLKNSAGTSVAGTLVYNSTTDTATFTPSAALAYGTTYTATVSGASNAASQTMGGSTSWMFTTVTRAPAVSAVTPASGAAGVAVAATERVTFNQAVQASTVVFTLKTSSGTAVAGTVSYNSTTNTATFTPRAALAYAATYTASVSGAKNSSGIAMSAPFSWSFTTDPLKPAVSFQSPASNAKGVSVSATPMVIFNQAMQPNTINFTLAAGNTPVAGSVSYQSATHSAIFTPTAVLAYNTVYTATLSSASDLDGDPISATLSWKFTTDPLQPKVTSEKPVPGATGVLVSAAPSATFNEAVQSSSITFTLTNGGTTVPGTVTYVSATNTATFTPSAPLAANTTYTATISGAIDTDGDPMSGSTTWSFTTVSTAPVVSSHTPASGATGVPVWSTPSATFNAPVQASTISFAVSSGAGQAVAGSLAYNSTTNTATFAPTAALAYNTTYTVTVSGVSDAAGDLMTAPFTWSFTTDPMQPKVSSAGPGSTGVMVTTSPTATFNEAVQSGTITFTLSGGGASVAGNVSYNSATNTATFAPSAALAYATTYTATVSGATNMAGDPMSGPFSWTFTTDPMQPRVTSETPASGTTGVAVSAAPTATFNEAVQSGTITFTLTNSAGTAVAGTASYNPATNTVTFTPTAALAMAATYTATVSGAKDTIGDPMAGSVSWSFTTDSALPVVSAHTPASGSTGVAVSAAPTATFSEAVQAGTITFALTSSSGAAVAGTATYNAATNTETFTPAVALAYGTTYTATVSGAKDKAGDPMSGSVSWSFSTDPLQPAVTAFTPAASGGKGSAQTGSQVAVTTAPTATFNEAVQSNTITFTLVSSAGTAVPGTVSYNATTNTATFTPTASLAYGTTYTATVSGAKDTAGDPMAGSTSWSFATDPLQPAVTSHTPASGSTGIAVSALPTATFNEAVQSGTISFTLASSTGAAIAGTVSYNATTNGATFTPTAALTYGTTYTATVSGAKDALGDPMAATSWSFATDPLQPAVSSHTPASGSTGVAVSAAPTATFNEAVQAGAITFNLTNSSGAAVAGTTAYNAATNTETFTPAAALAAGTTYTATVSGAKDNAGDPMNGSVSWSFTTKSSSSALTVSGGSNITTTPGATVTFAGAVSGGTAPYTYSWNFGDGITASSAGNTASFSQTDTTTQGNWSGAYGADGYDVIGSSASLPSYATITPSNAWSWTWAASTTDTRGLLVPGSSTSRIAATWFNPGSFDVDVDLTDGQAHPVSLYVVDWDSTRRSEQIQVLDASSGAVLNTQTVSNFNGGEYLTWNVTGDVEFQLTRLAGDNAVVSGFFFGSSLSSGTNTLAPTHIYASPGTYTATLTATDAAGHSGTASTVVTVKGVAPAVTAESPVSASTGVAVASTPTATFNEAVQSSSIVFTLVNSAGTSVAGTVSYNSTTNTATFAPSLALAYGTKYTATVSGAKDPAGDLMSGSTSWSFTTDPLQPAVSSHTPASGATGVALTAAPSATFNEPVQSGTISFTLTNAAGTAVAGAVSYNSATNTATFTPTAALAANTIYTATVSGAKDAAGDPMNGSTSWSFTSDPPPPTVTSHTPSSNATAVAVTSTPSVTFSEAVQSGTISFTLVSNGGTSVAGSLAYNSTTNTETFTPTSALANGTIYTATVSGAKDAAGDLMAGSMTWSFTTIAAGSSSLTVSAGSNITTNAGATVTFGGAVSGGTAPYTYSWNFGDGTASAANTASFSQADTTTQGNWSGVYGVAGYDVIGSSASLPSYAIMTPSAVSSYVWAGSTTDSRGLEIPGSTTNRIAAAWYTGSSFTVNLNLADAQLHAVSLYVVDWDSSGRSEQIQVEDASTGAVLNTQTVSSFSGGEYLTWNVSGNVQFVVTSLAGPNAVLSGIFLGAGSAAPHGGTLTTTHVYASPGTYTATLTSTDSAGHTGSSSTQVTVYGAVPTITAESPAANATNVAQSAAITATFNEAVQAGTINFTLTSSSGTAVAATVSYNSATDTATLTPSALLAYSSTYTASITAVVSTAGVAMTFPFSWSFSTTVVPTVLSEIPTSDATDLYNAGVGLSSPIAVTFNEPVRSGTISFSLNDSSGISVPASLAYNSGTQTATLTPSAALAYGTTYTATVSGAQNSAGLAMVAPFTFSFTTDAAPPTVILASPSSGATGVPVNSAVTAWFNQSIVTYFTMAGGNPIVTLATSSGTAVAATVAYNLQTNAVTLTPNAALAYGTTYTATASGAADAAGDPMTAPFSWSFTTVPSATALPTETSNTPAAGATGVSVTSAVTAYFNEAVTSSMTSFVLKTPAGTTVPATITYNSSTDSATLVPTSALTPATTYTALITGAVNSSGSGPVSWWFTTLGPTVITLSPPAAATGVPAVFTISATFNEAVQSGSITTSNFTLKTPSGASVAAAVAYNGATNTATLTPSAALAYSTTYTVALNGVKDASGYTMGSAMTWSFTTAPASLASILNTLSIPTTPGDRIWWTPARIQQAKAWATQNSYVPGANNPEDEAFLYVATGNTQAGIAAVNALMSFSVTADELQSVASNNYRWDPWVPVVFDWCYNLMTPAQVSTFVSEYNNYTQIILAKGWGGPGLEGNNYYWGYTMNALDWAIASYYINPMAPTFLYDTLVTRWQNGVLPYFAGPDAGGTPPEGSEYGPEMYMDPVIPFTTLQLDGYNILSQTNWYQQAVMNIIYDTSLSPINGNYIGFAYGDDQFSSGQPTFSGAWYQTNTYYQGEFTDFMTMMAIQYANQPIGQYARRWLNTIQGVDNPWVAAVDPGGPALSFSNLPLDYYAPGDAYLYTKNTWASSGTSILLQLGEGNNASHFQDDFGSFQINSGSQQLAVSHTGYSVQFADGSYSGETSAFNSILYNDIDQPNVSYILGPPQVLAVESTSTFTYAAVNLTNTYQSAYPGDEPSNPYAESTVRELLYIKPLNTLFIIDRDQASSASDTVSFLLHTIGAPIIADSNDITYTSGNQELFMKTLLTAGSRSYSVVDEGSTSAWGDIERLQDNFTGVANNVLLHAITLGPAGSDPVSVAITGQTSSTWTITFTSATMGTAVLVLNQGIFSLGGSFGYAATGTPALSALNSSIQGITVNSSGPSWGSSGTSGNSGVASVAMGAAPNIADSVTSNAATTSNGSGETSSQTSSGTASGAATNRETISAPPRAIVNQGTSAANDGVVDTMLPESLLDELGQDIVSSKQKKA
jgi:methionine-rich copper-binding protein CopC